MKLFKHFFTVLILFSPSFLSAQILEPRDIDIFIGGHEELEDAFDAVEERGGSYIDEMRRFTSLFAAYVFYETDEKIAKEDFAHLKTRYKYILELTPPRELAEVFASIGWTENGHKKHRTILFSMAVLKNSPDDSSSKKVLSLFGENDVAIIRGRIDDLEDL